MEHTTEIPRTILRLSGEDVHHFLQNLVTNSIDQLDQQPVYAALLTPQGKYISDFILVRDGTDVLLLVARPQAEALLQRLTMYKLRAKVTVEATDLKVRRGTGPAPEGAFQDPRHPALGWHLIGTQEGSDGTDFDAIRVAHCIPESGIELTPDTFILEAGFERLHGVDFRKGCYVGQEVTARMKHKTELRKGLRTVQVSGPADPGTEITANGKTAGQLFTRAGDQAIAYLRFDRAQPPMQAGEAEVTLPETQDG
ncbi:folate-binding protein YgfZ [Pseudooceanicola sp. HF7]|uniref:CAF17-like 4Fe-4S cluster assembly/insertion protein YgfZ n=1 Tax=Pseudooceanicola sp. HF7 TaxID=2721560 RepID=UPI00142F572B|nr:folate-binding protein YgfZ [Pseudooceanicola sp. HF7]NIZ09015.1 folate-binding protein YgfZ [Pseudooceanicola sp. HF7]